MADMARIDHFENAFRPEIVYGTGEGISTVAWDYQSIYGCLCDSSWTVGFDIHETQLAEFFGPDCSLSKPPSPQAVLLQVAWFSTSDSSSSANATVCTEHCPSGDDPFTALNETDCTGKSQVPHRKCSMPEKDVN